MNTNTNTSALDLAARILAWLGPNGRENSASLLLYEAMQELKRLGTPAMAAPAAQTPAADLQGLHDALLAPREIVRDELGHFSHPALPYCDEGTDTRKLMAAFGLQCKFVEMDGDAPEDFVDAYFEGDNPDCSDWTPTPPAGDGWALVCIFDSEDGPYAMFVRPEPREQVSRERAALPAQAVASVPKGLALVPIRLTRAMSDVMDEEGWQWDQLLEVAGAITEQQYAELAAPVQDVAPSGWRLVPEEATYPMILAYNTHGVAPGDPMQSGPPRNLNTDAYKGMLNAAAQPAAQPAETQDYKQAEFEAWYLDNNDVPKEAVNRAEPGQCRGMYAWIGTDEAWDVWTAAIDAARTQEGAAS